MSDKVEVLIAGGGIAGSCLAWWLNKRVNANITIIERAPEPRTSGQAVDIRDAAVDIIRRMGLEEVIQSKHTTEEGIAFIGPNGETKASFPSSVDSNKQALTSEYEILRGDLAHIFFDATKDIVDYVFDERVADLKQQSSGKVLVTFANHLPEKEYDLVVGADGMISQVRRILFGKGPQENDYLKRLGQYIAFFTIPKIESDTRWAKWYSAPKGRLILLRPSQYEDTRAYLTVTDGNLSRFAEIDEAMKQGPDAQMDWFENEFKDVGWQANRVLEGMRTANDLYISTIAQVKIEKFVSGSVALLGDAGYAPSPITGKARAYVLAGEISKSPSDVPAALERYQSVFRVAVDQVQSLPPGAPQIVNPQTEWGIKVLSSFLGVVSSGWIRSLASKVSSVLPDRRWNPPEYTTFST
ncbi:FAD/NAD(P)-binding domain-containing protein [Lophiostoma macrostomum CBS 122681]|uniref:FAD/NAD(P)-binding domain-containing protein n=1 Tax=Lophiostoma macrostomum CBS 122681 TaxID=1314788 RepID=A0A6A6SM63_9PLEO|nr:FAD/NAD(P)-binding domain-containing protein [Lophiostoma macrostomum CBS 122681]